MNKLFEQLSNEIKSSYEEGVTLEQAEKLAGKFLHAQIQIANSLASNDLDARMKKSGLKAVKAAVYLDEATRAEKKPTEAQLTALIDLNELVRSSQTAFDDAEVNRDKLQNYFSIFKEAHLHFRSIAKGRFE